jgi:hypothetical protein
MESPPFPLPIPPGPRRVAATATIVLLPTTSLPSPLVSETEILTSNMGKLCLPPHRIVAVDTRDSGPGPLEATITIPRRQVRGDNVNPVNGTVLMKLRGSLRSILSLSSLSLLSLFSLSLSPSLSLHSPPFLRPPLPSPSLNLSPLHTFSPTAFLALTPLSIPLPGRSRGTLLMARSPAWHHDPSGGHGRIILRGRQEVCMVSSHACLCTTRVHRWLPCSSDGPCTNAFLAQAAPPNKDAKDGSSWPR